MHIDVRKAVMARSVKACFGLFLAHKSSSKPHAASRAGGTQLKSNCTNSEKTGWVVMADGGAKQFARPADRQHGKASVLDM